MEITFWDMIVRYWVPIVTCSIVVAGFVGGSFTRWRKKVIAEVKAEVQSEEDNILSGQQTKVQECEVNIEKLESDVERITNEHTQYEKKMKTLYTDIKEQNDQEHHEINTTLRVVVMAIDKVLEVQSVSANGKTEGINKVRDVLKNHMYDKTAGG